MSVAVKILGKIRNPLRGKRISYVRNDRNITFPLRLFRITRLFRNRVCPYSPFDVIRKSVRGTSIYVSSARSRRRDRFITSFFALPTPIPYFVFAGKHRVTCSPPRSVPTVLFVTIRRGKRPELASSTNSQATHSALIRTKRKTHDYHK